MPQAANGLISKPDAAWKQRFTRQLLKWFQRHQRDLPWRRTRDAYQIWVSEIMLQQTQVVTVIPYFERFIAAFPTVKALAAADEQQVLRLWEGLGYYRRARQMHQAASVVVSEHGGRFPRDFAAIRALPGIGRYTAGAITSIAYDVQAPILEANTVRLLSRLVGFAGDATSTKGQAALWGLAESILPREKCGTFNQALMELGSLVCTPRNPQCETCPVRALCVAVQQERPEAFPAPKARPKIEAVREASVAVWRGGRVLVRKCAPGERWAGLWDFLRFPLASEQPDALAVEIADKVRAQSGVVIDELSHFTTLKHGVTRFRITLDCYSAAASGGKATLPRGEYRWIEPASLADLPLSVTGRAVSRILAK